uniref:Uncharacterized protein n=1 Tax=Arundo donax TaxID=35708 RepID=A0A0A9FHR5_ARUDO
MYQVNIVFALSTILFQWEHIFRIVFSPDIVIFTSDCSYADC